MLYKSHQDTSKYEHTENCFDEYPANWTISLSQQKLVSPRDVLRCHDSAPCTFSRHCELFREGTGWLEQQGHQAGHVAEEPEVLVGLPIPRVKWSSAASALRQLRGPRSTSAQHPSTTSTITSRPTSSRGRPALQ